MKNLSVKERAVISVGAILLVAFAIYFAYSDMIVRRMKSPYEEANTFAMGTYVMQKVYSTGDNPENITLEAYGRIKSLENRGSRSDSLRF